MNELTGTPEENGPQHSGVRKRHLKARRVAQLLSKRTGRLFLAFVFLGIVFASVAILQHWFVRKQLYRTTRQELGSWAAQVTVEIAYKDKWDLSGYRQASITAPSWSVVAKDGLIVDVEGFIPGLFGKVEPPDESIYTAPKTVTTAVGETWRLFGRKVAGGFVIVVICSPENTANADTRLLANAAKFGSTLEEATSIRSRGVDFDVDYAVVSSAGDLKAAWGGVPLRTDYRALPTPSDHMALFVSKDSSYLLYFEPIFDARGQEVGAVIVPKDMSLEQQALKLQDRFNFWIAGASMVLACAIALSLVVQEFRSQAKAVPLEEALRIGESRTVEFKSTFQWDLRRNQYVEDRRLDVLKSIAGFLNARGGTLFIGVSEERNPPVLRGLNEDLAYVGGSRDQLQRTLRDLISTRIGSEFAPLIADTLEQKDGQIYWPIVVEESPEPAFVRWKPAGESKEQKKFYVREGPKTSDLDNESTWHYIKNRWG